MDQQFVSTDHASLRVEHLRNPGAPPLLFLNSIGTSLEMWDHQVHSLAGRYEIVRFDARGHGESTAGRPPEATIESLASDALAVMDACGMARAHLCGLSLGGMVAMHIAAHSPERVLKAVLCNTTPYMPPREMWDARIETVRMQGMGPLVEGTLQRWFTAGFHQAHPDEVDRIRSQLRRASPAGFAACCAAIRDMDQRESIRSIRAGTLVIGGTEDAGTTPAHARDMASAIPGAHLVMLDAAHLTNIERAGDFTAALDGFLADVGTEGR
jgi:3-oxoadipate enol-lactonase